MPIIETGGAKLHYQIEGANGAPVLVLSNSLGTELGMWAPQMPRLLEHFRVLRYDARGHGGSQVTPGPYTIAQLAADVIGLLDHLQHRARAFLRPVDGRHDRHVARRPSRRSASSGWCCAIRQPASAAGSLECAHRTGQSRRHGADRRRRGRALVHAGLRGARAATSGDGARKCCCSTAPAGYVANCAAVRDMDQRDGLDAIRAPTLVIAGSHDKATPPADGRFVAQQIGGARYLELDAAHLSNWEQAERFTAALVDFLTA